jgi:septation ring formation regulator EzrA
MTIFYILLILIIAFGFGYYLGEKLAKKDEIEDILEVKKAYNDCESPVSTVGDDE